MMKDGFRLGDHVVASCGCCGGNGWPRQGG